MICRRILLSSVTVDKFDKIPTASFSSKTRECPRRRFPFLFYYGYYDLPWVRVYGPWKHLRNAGREPNGQSCRFHAESPGSFGLIRMKRRIRTIAAKHRPAFSYLKTSFPVRRHFLSQGTCSAGNRDEDLRIMIPIALH